MDEKLKDMDVLLVREQGSNELKVADKDGKTKAIKPEDGDNLDLFKINMRGNLVENFFENFKRQVKDPTRFEFFRVPAEKFQEGSEQIAGSVSKPRQAEKQKAPGHAPRGAGRLFEKTGGETGNGTNTATISITTAGAVPNDRRRENTRRQPRHRGLGKIREVRRDP
jgi:hypothetical protein